ncbi:hypothetical protein D0Y65_007120 [Glycine soja]|uniref:Arabinogalactan peptide 23 n=1 Tax=Glycine soja TaxID=3848 RepID=A0A445LBZ3_GLYSO|nr:hypothetical protein D0Y65_007120 [Glycine soja]
MDMKKVTCALLIAAASMSAAVAAAEAPAPSPGPGPSSGASAPLVGSLIGASVLSFFALFHLPSSTKQQISKGTHVTFEMHISYNNV